MWRRGFMGRFKNGKWTYEYADEYNKYWEEKGYNCPVPSLEIAEIAESIVDYLGSEYEEVVLDAIKTTKVALVGTRPNGVRETVADVLEREGMSDEIAGKSDKDLRNIEGMYCEKPNIVFREEGYEITSVEKLAVINSQYIPDNIYFLGKLAATLLSAVKSHLRTYSIDGDTLTIRQGLEVRTEKLSHNGNTVSRSLVSDFGHGLEQASTAYDTLSFMRETYYDDYDLHTHGLSVLVAGQLFDGLKLRDIIREAQITKDTRALEEMIDAHTVQGYAEFMRSLDTLRGLEEARNMAAGTDNHMDASDKLEEYYNVVIASIMRNMRTSMRMSVAQDMSVGEGNTI